MSRDIDFGTRATKGPKRRVEDSALHRVILSLEVDFFLAAPKRIAHGQELFGTGIPLIVFEEIAVGVLFDSGTASDHIQSNAPAHQQGERVELLDKGCWLHPAGTVGCDELEL